MKVTLCRNLKRKFDRVQTTLLIRGVIEILSSRQSYLLSSQGLIAIATVTRHVRHFECFIKIILDTDRVYKEVRF